MSKFGKLIDKDIPVLLMFYAEWNEDSIGMTDVMRDLSVRFQHNASIIKIDVDKNQELSEALRVKDLPTFMLYKHGVQEWRVSGGQDRERLIGVIQKYV